jgi:DNA-binding MarR family transcriptional regulator
VAARLKVDEGEARRQLREAERDGLVHQDVDLSASLSDDQREFWMLTPEGRAVWDRLDAEQEP